MACRQQMVETWLTSISAIVGLRYRNLISDVLQSLVYKYKQNIRYMDAFAIKWSFLLESLLVLLCHMYCNRFFDIRLSSKSIH